MQTIASPDADAALSFADDGVIVVRNTISASWLDVLRGVADDLRSIAYDITENEADAPNSSHFKDNCWTTNPDVRRFIVESGVVTVAAGVLSSHEIRLYGDGFFRRDAGAKSASVWHQDEQAWPLRGRQMCSVWLSTESVDPDSGALRFVLGSHRGPLYTPSFAPKDGRVHHETYDAVMPDVSVDPAAFPQVSFALDPGDVLVFHPRMLHAAFGSRTDRPRRSFSFRFLGDDIRWQRKEAVFLDDLLAVPLQDGDRIRGARFPTVWTRDGGPVRELEEISGPPA